MDRFKRGSRTLRMWCAVSDAIGADIIGGAAVLIVVLVGVGEMHPQALGGSGALASLAAVLYRRRPVSGPYGEEGGEEAPGDRLRI